MSPRIALLFVLLGACLMAAPARATPPIEHWQTAAGTRVYFIETHDLPMLDVSVDFPAGSVFDTAEMSGLAALTQRLLRLVIRSLPPLRPHLKRQCRLWLPPPSRWRPRLRRSLKFQVRSIPGAEFA